MKKEKILAIVNDLPEEGDYMTPEQRARSIILMFMKRKKKSIFIWKQLKDVKKCALIACQTHIYSENSSPFPNMATWVENEKYWHSVKKAIKVFKP